MKDIKNIMEFVTLVHDNDTLDKSLHGNAGHKVVKFARALREEEVEDDKHAMKLIYGNSRRSERYRKLKSRLKERLIDFVILHNTGKQFKSPYDLSLFTIQRNLLAAEILYLRDHRISALALFKPALQSALYYNHHHLALQACRYLCIYASTTGKKKDWQNYSILYEKLCHLHAATLKMEHLSNEVTSIAVNTIVYDTASEKRIEENFRKAGEIFKRHSSHPIRIFYYRIAYHYYHSRHEYSKIIGLCRKCSAYLESHPQFYQRVRAGEFALMEMEAALQLGRFYTGKDCADRCHKHFVPFTSPWFVYYEYYFRLAMLSGNYLQALNIFYTVMPTPRNHKLSAIQHERWRILEAYLNFSLPDALPKKQFNLFRFLNEVPLAGHDKAGYNFAVLIAQVILLINIRNIEHLLNIEEPLRQYLHRHIQPKKHPRHYIFGRMLLILFRNDFKPDGLQEKIKPYLQKLKLKKNGYSSLEEMEVIPYEKVWEMLVEKCRTLY